MQKNIILFCCLLCILLSLSLYAKNIALQPNERTNITTSTQNTLFKVENNKRQPQSNELVLTKESLLDANYYQAPDSNLIQSIISKHLTVISKICENPSLSFNQQVNNLENNLQKLRQTIDAYLKQPYLKIKDAIYLRSINHNISRTELSLGEKLTGSFIKEIKLDLSRNFLRGYRIYYHITTNDDQKDQIDISDLKHQWAKQIYTGLKCIVNENTRLTKDTF